MSAPASRVPAEHTDDVEIVKHDAIEQLCYDIEQIVDCFGPGAADGVKASMETDALNMKNLDSLQQRLMQQGRVKEADEVARQSREILDTSMDQLVKLRRHVSNIAELLIELPACADDSNASVSVLQEIQGTASEAFVVAANGQKVYADASDRLLALCSQFQAEYEGAQKDAAESEKRSKEHAERASTHHKKAVIEGGVCLIPMAATIGHAVATSVVHGTGHAVATSVVHGTGHAVATNVVHGTGHAVATSVVQGTGTAGILAGGPPGVLIGAGMTILFGCMAVCDYMKRGDEAQAAIAEKQAQENALRKKGESELHAEGAREAADVACKTKDLMDYHKQMWAGISMSADEAQSTLKSLAKAGSRSTTGKLFTDRMNKFGEQLHDFVRAIDSYMFWLSKTGYFPPNFNVRSIMGTQAYNQLQAAFTHQSKTRPQQSKTRAIIDDAVRLVA